MTGEEKRIEEKLNTRIQEETQPQQQKNDNVKPPTGVVATRIDVEPHDLRKAGAETTGIVDNKKLDCIVSEAQSGTKAEQMLMVPSEMHAYYNDEGFGRADVTIKNLENNAYHFNHRPLAIDQSPLKELTPDFEDIQPITSYRKNLGHENAYIYSFVLPEGVRGAELSLKNDCPYGTATAWSIPALTILKENLFGLPRTNTEWPLISSANPTTSNSYLHSVQHRVDRSGILDLRFKLSASRKARTREIYLLGRCWSPLDIAGITWENSPDNYDAASPVLYPAFADIGKITLDTKKELTNVMQTLRFVDRNFSPDVEQNIINVMEGLARNKLSLSRLYWRIWCCIAEASLVETQHKRWHVERIHNAFTPMTLNGPIVLREIFSQAQMGVQPFFITHNMLENIGGDNVTALLLFLLCDNFDAKCHFGISKCWPPLGDVRVILPADHKALYNLPTRLSVNSESLYSLLSYFARVLGQQHLIDEIGKTVSMFLLRPEGDHTWLAHNFISIKLPMFRCKRSLHFAWSSADSKLAYPFKAPPYYKLAWIGAIRYLQIALAANTALSEMGLFTALQLENNGYEMSNEWCRTLLGEFRRDQGACQFNMKIQYVGLRCDWGCLLNRITGSIIINRPILNNFMRLPQWQEWLLFQRLQPESTWMAGQMGHIKPKTLLKPQHSYNPILSGIESGLGDIYYRLLTENSAKLMLHIESIAQGRMIIKEATSLSSVTGFPLDGQFRHFRAEDDAISYYHFVPRNEIDCSIITNGWYKKLEFHWQLHCPQQFLHNTMGVRDGEVFLESSALAPDTQYNTGFFEANRSVQKICRFEDSYETRNYGIAVYGTPSSILEPVEEEDSSETPYTEESEEWLDGVPYEVMHNQEYPIHYCDSHIKPSVAELMMRYGIKLETTTAGVSLLTPEESYKIAARAEYLHPSITYISPNYPRAFGAQDDKTTLRDTQSHKDVLRQDQRGAGSTRVEKKMEALAHKLRKRREKRSRERKKELRKAEDIVRERAVTKVPVKSTNTRVDVSKHKNEFRHFAKSNNLDISRVEADPRWKLWDSLELLNTATTGSRESLEHRYSEILLAYNALDLTLIIRAAPRIARIELCRTVVYLMEESVQYMSPGHRYIHIHDKIKTFLTTAIANLSQCNIMTEEELHDFYGCKHLKFDDWQIYGTLSPEAFWTATMKWSESVYNCPLWGEHDPQFGPDSEEERQKAIGKDEGKGEMPKRTLEDAQLIEKLDSVVNEVIGTNTDSPSQGFRSAREHCSAQSPKSSVCSPAVNFTDNTSTNGKNTRSKNQPPSAIKRNQQITSKNKVSQQKASNRKVGTSLPGSTVAQRTRAQTKMKAALRDALMTAPSLESYLTSGNTLMNDVADVGKRGLAASFEKMPLDSTAQSAPASTPGSPIHTLTK